MTTPLADLEIPSGLDRAAADALRDDPCLLDRLTLALHAGIVGVPIAESAEDAAILDPALAAYARLPRGAEATRRRVEATVPRQLAALAAWAERDLVAPFDVRIAESVGPVAVGGGAARAAFAELLDAVAPRAEIAWADVEGAAAPCCMALLGTVPPVDAPSDALVAALAVDSVVDRALVRSGGTATRREALEQALLVSLARPFTPLADHAWREALRVRDAVDAVGSLLRAAAWPRALAAMEGAEHPVQGYDLAAEETARLIGDASGRALAALAVVVEALCVEVAPDAARRARQVRRRR